MGNGVNTTEQESKGVVKPEETTKEKKVSVSYTVQRLKNTIEALVATKLVTAEEAKTLKDLHKKVVERWIALEMFK